MPPRWDGSTTSPSIWWLDGEWIESRGVGPSVPPRFGETPPHVEGVREVIRVRDGICEFGAEHVERLLRSAATLDIPLTFGKSEVMQAVDGIVRRNPPGDMFLRLYAIRTGPDPRGGGDLASDASSMRIEGIPFTGFAPRPMSEGFRLVTAHFRRDERSPLARMKTLHSEEARLARLLARESAADETLILNTAGRIAGASAANLHLVFEGILVTPPLEEGAFPGIVRGAVLRAAREIGIEARERPIPLDALQRTPEAFLTSTEIGLAPIAAIDGVPLPPPARVSLIPKLRIRFRGIATGEGMER